MNLIINNIKINLIFDDDDQATNLILNLDSINFEFQHHGFDKVIDLSIKSISLLYNSHILLSINNQNKTNGIIMNYKYINPYSLKYQGIITNIKVITDDIYVNYEQYIIELFMKYLPKPSTIIQTNMSNEQLQQKKEILYNSIDNKYSILRLKQYIIEENATTCINCSNTSNLISCRCCNKIAYCSSLLVT